MRGLTCLRGKFPRKGAGVRGGGSPGGGGNDGARYTRVASFDEATALISTLRIEFSAITLLKCTNGQRRLRRKRGSRERPWRCALLVGADVGGSPNLRGAHGPRIPTDFAVGGRARNLLTWNVLIGRFRIILNPAPRGRLPQSAGVVNSSKE